MNRTRTRTFPHTGYFNTSPYYDPWRTIHETRVSPRVTNVKHYKHTPVSGIAWSNLPHYYSNLITADADFEAILGTLRSHTGQEVSIPWHKLPTSNQFNSLAFLAELRESIGMFSIRTVQQILKNPKGIWGFLEFGFSPFISDLVAILDLIECFRQIPVTNVPFSTSYVQSFSVANELIGKAYYHGYGTSHIRFSGEIVRDLTSLPQLADVMGFKPDLATLWELTPLSFVLDYFLPIGDYLDNVVRSGWTSSIQFTGYISEKTNLVYNRSSLDTTVTHFHSRFYKREYVTATVPVVKQDKIISPDIPSLKQIFNTVYIAASSTKSRKRIGSSSRFKRPLF